MSPGTNASNSPPEKLTLSASWRMQPQPGSGPRPADTEPDSQAGLLKQWARSPASAFGSRAQDRLQSLWQTIGRHEESQESQQRAVQEATHPGPSRNDLGLLIESDPQRPSEAARLVQSWRESGTRARERGAASSASWPCFPIA